MNGIEGAGLLVGPYFQHALEVWQAGLCPIPCGGPDGKQPLVRWRDYQRYKPYREVVEAWARRFPTANIGTLTGPLYGITVVDDDKGRTHEALYEQFGPTPLVTQSASSNLHCWYAFNGEKSATNAFDGLDIKGSGGLVIIPPSRRPADGALYRFLCGDWSNLSRLPKINPGVLTSGHPPPKPSQAKQRSHPGASGIGEGQRNEFLFYQARLLAHTAECEADLLSELNALNTINCEPPLDPAEINRVCGSVWRMKTDGRLIEPVGRCAVLPAALVRNFELSDKAHRLQSLLMLEHNGKAESFAISIDGLHQLTGWAPNTLRRARDELVTSGYIKLVKQGGRGEHDPNLYRLDIQGFKN